MIGAGVNVAFEFSMYRVVNDSNEIALKNHDSSIDSVEFAWQKNADSRSRISVRVGRSDRFVGRPSSFVIASIRRRTARRVAARIRNWPVGTGFFARCDERPKRSRARRVRNSARLVDSRAWRAACGVSRVARGVRRRVSFRSAAAGPFACGRAAARMGAIRAVCDARALDRRRRDNPYHVMSQFGGADATKPHLLAAYIVRAAPAGTIAGVAALSCN